METVNMEINLWAVQPDPSISKQVLIADAARVCYASSGTDNDKLLSDLAKWGHMSPFEHGIWCWLDLTKNPYKQYYAFRYGCGISHSKEGCIVSMNGRSLYEMGGHAPISREYNYSRGYNDLSNEEKLHHMAFTFHIKGISRACSHQLVRHRAASYSQQSMRYCAQESDAVEPHLVNGVASNLFSESVYGSWEDYTDLLSLGVKKEDARGVLPIATQTTIVVTMKLWSFLHFLKLRLHHRAQAEIREMAQEMARIASEEDVFVKEKINEISHWFCDK